MNNYQRQRKIYDMLGEVYFGDAYSGIALSRHIGSVPPDDRAFVTRVFYGVIEKNNYLEYAVSHLTKSPPRPKIALILKIGLYQLYFTSQPDYAVVSASVELTKSIGKKQLAGFVNAVLKNYRGVVFPGKENQLAYLTVQGGAPEWLASKLLRRYGFDFACEMLTAKLPLLTHIRHNPAKISREEFEKKYDLTEKSSRGYYVTAEQMHKMQPDEYTAQSLASIYAAEFYIKGLAGGKTLDLCAAPGGKAVLMAQSGGFDVTACDIHPHRLELIEKYARRMGVSLTLRLSDATVAEKSWIEAFGLVVCDVPCSGIGVAASKPDVMLRKTAEECAALPELQKKILETAALYVKPGGRLCYSTCTVLQEENQDVVEEFLRSHGEFETEKADDDGIMSLFPNTDGCDGFFAARMRRRV